MGYKSIVHGAKAFFLKNDENAQSIFKKIRKYKSLYLVLVSSSGRHRLYGISQAVSGRSKNNLPAGLSYACRRKAGALRFSCCETFLL